MCQHPRDPIYNKDKNYRIISLPNGHWQLQRYADKKGTRTFDPWVKASHPGSLKETHVLLRATEII